MQIFSVKVRMIQKWNLTCQHSAKSVSHYTSVAAQDHIRLIACFLLDVEEKSGKVTHNYFHGLSPSLCLEPLRAGKATVS